MIAFLNFDAASVEVLERLTGEGRLPTLSSLLERGTRIELDSPARRFAAGTYHSLYTGLDVPRHGLYYPFVWSAGEQRARPAGDFAAPAAIWERLARAGRRCLVVDAYEGLPPRELDGTFLGGVQLTNRVVMPPASRPRHTRRRVLAAIGAAPRVDEVFGTPTPSALRRMRRHLLAAPGRCADAATTLLARERYDLLWLSFAASHIAGHQFWDVRRALGDPGADGLAGTIDEVYVAVDRAIGRVLDVLPEDADVIVFSALGMSDNTSQVDLLAGLLDAVLAGGVRRGDGGARNPLWRLRSSVPTSVRGALAAALPRRLVLDLMSRLEVRASDWRDVRAFALPSDVTGYVRVNLRGREREGVVEPEQLGALCDELAAGLPTFATPDGEPAVAFVERVDEVLEDAPMRDRLPDLIVHWGPAPATAMPFLCSPTFGEVRRQGLGSGRTGNHTADAWAVLVPGASRLRPAGRAAVVDLPATALATLGVDPQGLDGQPLLEP